MDVTYFFRNKKSGYSIEKALMPLVKYCLNDKNINIKIYHLPYYKADPLSIIKNLIYVRKHRNKNGINHVTGGAHYIELALTCTKSILTIHDLVLLNANVPQIKKFIFKLLWFTLPCKLANKVVCISDTTQKALFSKTNVDKSKTLTIHNPLPTSYYYREHIFNCKKPRILHIGTGWNKNLLRVIKALKNIDCQLIIIGDIQEDILNSLRTEKIDYIQKSNISDKEILNEYINCDIVSFPSIFEGFGMPIIEGQAIGRAVLTSNINPMVEVSGQAACLVNPFSIKSIRDGFLKIINDHNFRTGIITNGLKNAYKYKVDIIAKEYIKIYKELS